MIIRTIKNVSDETKIYLGQVIEPAASYEIAPSEAWDWSNDQSLINDIISGLIVVGDGSVDFVDYLDGLKHLNYTDTYYPANLEDWPTSTPTTIKEALDSIASRLKKLEI